MKVAVTAESSELASSIDPRFGRAPWLVLFDTATHQVSAHDNRNAAAAAHGAGSQTAQVVIGLGVDAVISGNVGPNAFRALEAAGITIYLTYAGTVERTIERLRAGTLNAAAVPSRGGHGDPGGS